MTYRPPHKTLEKTSYQLQSNSLDSYGGKSMPEKNRGSPISVTYHDGKTKIVDGNRIVTFEDLARIKSAERATSFPW